MTTPIDDDLIGPICELADLDITNDYHLDQLILAARTIRDREGFLVVDDDDLPTAQDVRGILAKCPICDGVGSHQWNCTLNK